METSGRLQVGLVSSSALQKAYSVKLNCNSRSALGMNIGICVEMFFGLYVYFTEGSDFNCVNSSIGFAPNETTVNFYIKLTKDKMCENKETFIIQIIGTSSSRS